MRRASCDRADAAADGQRDEHLARGAGHHVHHGVALVARCGDVEEDQFVGALLVVAVGQLHRIAGIAQVDEVDALDHAAGGDIETGNDAFGEHLQLHEVPHDLAGPAGPDFSGWNCTPKMLSGLEHGGVAQPVVAGGR